MRVACGLSLFTSATALCYQVVLGHRSCVARVNPAMARLGKPTALLEADGAYVGPDVGNGDLDLLQELDAIEPTLSYQGWQKDVAEIEESYIQVWGGTPASRASLSGFFELRGKQERHDQVLRWLRELDELKTTLSYEGWQEDVAKIEELQLGFPEQFRDSSSFGKAEQLAKMRRKQQVHDRRLTRPGWPVPPDEIEDEVQPL